MKITPKPTCAIAYSIQQLGDKWSLLIMRDLVLHKKTRFKELRESKEKIASNILANRLKSLQLNGFIEKLDPTGTKKSTQYIACLLYTSPSPRDKRQSRMPSSA